MAFEKVESAYLLWQNNLINDDIFFGILRNLKGVTINSPINSNGITSKQKDYIIKLKIEGKIPQEQRLDISKAEAQALIKGALDNPQVSNKGTSNASPRPKESFPIEVKEKVDSFAKTEGGVNPPSSDELYIDEETW